MALRLLFSAFHHLKGKERCMDKGNLSQIRKIRKNKESNKIVENGKNIVSLFQETEFSS